MSRLARAWARTRDLSFFATEALFLSLLPRHPPGPVLRRVFRIPLLLYRIGGGRWLGRRFLVLTTRGRRTGRPHRAVLDHFRPDGGSSYFVMAGWGGATDWCRNLGVDDRVTVTVGTRSFAGRARRLSPEPAGRVLASYRRHNPFADRLLSRWAGVQIDGSEEGIRAAVEAFPVFVLEPAA